MEKTKAIVFRGEGGELFVLPIENLEMTKVHESSQKKVLENLMDGETETRIDSSLSLVGRIDLEKLEKSVDFWMGPEPIWPAFKAPKSQDE